ncbi:MAG TPA: hypothetical protein PKH50_00155 [bacterium]|nr:hypothetical protein [bacterium]
MSLLAAHFDVSGVDFLFKKSKKDVELFSFPYVYSKGIFSNQCNEKQFYTYLVEKVLLDRGVKPNLCSILISSFFEPLELDIKTKLSVGVSSLIENSNEMTPVFVNNCAFMTEGIISSQETYWGERRYSEGEAFGEQDDEANFFCYPQIIPEDISSQISVDSQICEKIPEKFIFESGRKLVFTGGRFSQKIPYRESDYILILEILRGLGIFEVYLDKFNSFALSKTIQMYDRSLVQDIWKYFEKSGLFIRTGGACECLLSTGLGDDQFIEIEENKIFVLPVKLENPARLSVKSHGLGTIDIRTMGGEIGLIFDTRVENKSIYSDVKLLNDCMKQFEVILNKK